MRLVHLVLSLLIPVHALAGDQQVSASSPGHRIAVLELYTSEGCSSCPPADRFMSRLKQAGKSDRQLIPLSFHVTYWDYLGWKDRFGNPQYDERQRKQAMLNASRTVYTPQFMLNGKDYRARKSFDEDIQRINTEAASYQLKLTAKPRADTIDVELNTVSLLDNPDNAVAYIAFYEHNLSSQVTAGENEGSRLRHDYVVRELKGPYLVEQEQAVFKTVFNNNGYQLENSGIVAFIQEPLGSEILQAVSLELVE